MKTSEILATKIGTLLGSNYHIFSDMFFNKNYTEAREVREGENIGYARFTTAEYGKFRKNKVVGILTLTSYNRSNSNVFYANGGFKIEFSVPRNVVKTTKNDEVLSQPAYDFDADMETLANTITNQKITFTVQTGQTTKTYNGRLSVGEPNYLMTESDGEFQYDIMTLTGTFAISDNAYFGGDYKVELYLDDAYVELDDITSYTEQLNEDANAILKGGKIKTEKNVGQSNWVCTVSIDDYKTQNAARLFIYNCVHENKEILNSSASNEALKRKIRVRIKSPSSLAARAFNAIMTISFTTTKNGVGSYAISFTDDNKDILQHTLFFDANGGSEVASKTVKEGQLIGALPIPVREGYTLSGWKIGNTLIQPNMTYNYIEDKTATAVWTANTYTIFFNSNGGTGGMSMQTIDYDRATPLEANAFIHSNTVDNVTYTANFLGWSKNPNAKTPTYTDEQEVLNLAIEGMVVLYAIWENYTMQFRITALPLLYLTKTFVYGDLLGALPEPTLPVGITFNGWKVNNEAIDENAPYKWQSNVIAQADIS